MLFDSGATHSFISNDYAKFCPLEAEELDPKLAVIRPAGVLVSCNRIIYGYLVTIEGRLMPTNLVVFQMNGFNVILGTD